MKSMTRESCIVLGVSAALVAVATVLVYLPQGRRLEELRSQKASKLMAMEADSQKVSVVPSLLRQIEALKGRFRDFDRRLPKHKELGGFLGEISSNLSEENLADPEIVPGNPTAEELFHTLPILMRSRGSYLSVAGFLDRISKMQRLTRVHTLRIARDAKDDRPKIEMQLNIYFTQT